MNYCLFGTVFYCENNGNPPVMAQVLTNPSEEITIQNHTKSLQWIQSQRAITTN